MIYARRQTSWLARALSVALAGAVIAFLWLTPARKDISPIFGTCVALSGVALVWIFSEMTIRVDATRVEWTFAYGAWRQCLPKTHIARVVIVPARWLDGIGVHQRSDGWVYRVGGAHLVALVHGDGGRTYLGADAPQELCAALQTRPA
jgi:hypothetical protein